MNKKTIIAGGAFAFLGAVSLGVLRTPEKGQRVGEGPRPLAKLSANDFDTLEIIKDGKATTLKRTGAEFSVTAPVQYAADKEPAKEAFEAVEQLEFGSVISDQKTKHKEFEVAEGALHIVAKKGDKALANFYVGKTLGTQTLIRLEGKDEVWQAKGSLKFKFDKDTAAWRDKVVTSFTEADATKLDVKAADGSHLVMEKAAKDPAAKEAAPADDGWKVKESSLPIEHLDKTVPEGIISALSNLRTNDFADDAKVEETGLASPKLTLAVTLKDGKSHSVLIGNKKGDEDFFLKREGSDQVFIAKKWNIERANKRPADFREKLVCNVPSGDVLEVSVTRKEDSFTLTKGKGPDEWKLGQLSGVELDNSKATAIAGYFSDWKATAFAESNSPAATGLDKPTATVVVKSKNKGSSCALRIGAATPDKASSFVQIAGQADVMLAPQWQIDRVLAKKDDLKKK
jgi:hypothetical protein